MAKRSSRSKSKSKNGGKHKMPGGKMPMKNSEMTLMMKKHGDKRRK